MHLCAPPVSPCWQQHAQQFSPDQQALRNFLLSSSCSLWSLSQRHAPAALILGQGHERDRQESKQQRAESGATVTAENTQAIDAARTTVDSCIPPSLSLLVLTSRVVLEAVCTDRFHAVT